MSEEVKVEEKNIISIDIREDFSDIFVSDNDTFDVIVDYYKKDNSVFVKGLDDSYDNNVAAKSFTLTFRYPNQEDFTQIGTAGRAISLGQEITIKEFILLEFSRLVRLLKSWSLKNEISIDIISKMNPKIVKYITSQIRNKIGMDGIV